MVPLGRLAVRRFPAQCRCWHTVATTQIGVVALGQKPLALMTLRVMSVHVMSVHVMSVHVMSVHVTGGACAEGVGWSGGTL